MKPARRLDDAVGAARSRDDTSMPATAVARGQPPTPLAPGITATASGSTAEPGGHSSCPSTASWWK